MVQAVWHSIPDKRTFTCFATAVPTLSARLALYSRSYVASLRWQPQSGVSTAPFQIAHWEFAPPGLESLTCSRAACGPPFSRRPPRAA